MGLEVDPNVAPAPAPRTPVYTGPGWNLAQRVAFRFVLVYLILDIFPFPITAFQGLLVNIHQLVAGEQPDRTDPPFLFEYVVNPISEYVTTPYAKFWDRVVVWTGDEVFQANTDYRPMGSGDTTWSYVRLFDFAVGAAAVALLWTLAAGIWWKVRRRSRLGYPHLHEWLRVFVRFYLASTLIGYGSVKLIKLQFSYPGPDQLLETYGESSPMRLLWTFMGASDGYTWFTGAGEVLAGVLLLTRRTTLLGALVSFGVMVHVVALNFCYDVPVKIFSTHLALMAVFLMAPDLPWLTRVFVLGQQVTPRAYVPLVRRPWLDWALFVVRTLIVLTFLGVTFYDNHEQSKLYGRLAPEPPLFGLWEVEEFTLDGTVRPPLTTDAGRWQRVVFNKGRTFSRSQPAVPSVMIRNMPGKFLYSAEVAVDEEAQTITLTRPGGPPGSGRPSAVEVLRYTVPEEDVIEVEGEVQYFADGRYGPRTIKSRLRHYGKDKFLLSSRGFHWINEMPYNRNGPKNEPPPKIIPPPKRP